MAHRMKALLIAAIFAGLAWGVASAAQPPADPCSLLPSAQISKLTGQTYNTPQKTVAPRPYANTVEGTDCTYKNSNGRGQILFRAYADPSASEAASLFAKLGLFYSPQTPVAGLVTKRTSTGTTASTS